jgi:hypothetical protein
MNRIHGAALALVMAFAALARAQQEAPNTGPAEVPPADPPPAAAQPLPAPPGDNPPPPLPGQLPAQLFPPTPAALSTWDPAQPTGAWNNRFWVTNEVLVWWMKNGPLSMPLITTSDAADVGTIGAPSTTVAFGGSGLNFGGVAGYRLTVGGWFDDDRTFGMEGRGLFMGQTTIRANVQSDANGNPTIAIPIYDPRTGTNALPFGTQPAGATLPGNAGLFITSANSFSGGIAVNAGSHLSGGEANGLCCLIRTPWLNVNAITGFRYLDLNENIGISTLALGLPTDPVAPNLLFYTSDQFRARSQFFGGQLGLQTGVQHNRWNVNLRTTVGLGSTLEMVSRHGDTTIASAVNPFVTPLSFPSGLLITPTNTGTLTRNAFGVVPDVQLQVGYMLTRTIQVFVGYNFLYWNNVVRPGDQIDTVVNPTQVPAFGGTSLVGPARPAPLFNTTNFWAQGINIGLAWQF